MSSVYSGRLGLSGVKQTFRSCSKWYPSSAFVSKARCHASKHQNNTPSKRVPEAVAKLCAISLLCSPSSYAFEELSQGAEPASQPVSFVTGSNPVNALLAQMLMSVDSLHGQLAAHQLSLAALQSTEVGSTAPQPLASSEELMEVAEQISQSALTLAIEANRLAAYDAATEAEKVLAAQVSDAARILSVVAGRLADQEAAWAGLLD